MKSPTAIWMAIAILSMVIGIGIVDDLRFRAQLKALEDDSYVQQKEIDVTAAYLRETSTQATANKIIIDHVAKDTRGAHDRLDALEAVRSPACQCAKAEAVKPAFVVPKPPAPPKIDTNPRPWRGQ